MQDAIPYQLNVVISDKTVVIPNQAGILLHSIWTFEVLINHSRDRVERGGNIPSCGFFE